MERNNSKIEQISNIMFMVAAILFIVANLFGRDVIRIHLQDKYILGLIVDLHFVSTGLSFGVVCLSLIGSRYANVLVSLIVTGVVFYQASNSVMVGINPDFLDLIPCTYLGVAWLIYAVYCYHSRKF